MSGSTLKLVMHLHTSQAVVRFSSSAGQVGGVKARRHARSVGYTATNLVYIYISDAKVVLHITP